MPPKKPFKLPKLPKKPSKQEPVLTTAQDFLDQGVAEEESGDRWLLSDLSKTLRFYQKAYDYYIVGTEKDNRFIDCYYNANRLLFHIYDVFKNVNVVDLSGIEGCNVLNYSLGDIKTNHELVIQRFIESGDERLINWDFYYNLLLIDTEWIEKNDRLSFIEVESTLRDSIHIVNKILDLQLVELDTFVRRLENPEEDEIKQPTELGDTSEASDAEYSYDVIEQITPSVTFETLLSSLKLIQAGYEAADNKIQLNHFKDLLIGFFSRIEGVSKLILDRFDPSLSPQDPYEINLKKDDIDEFHLIRTYINGLFVEDFESLKVHWAGFPNDNLSRYLIEADSYETFKSDNDLPSDQLWEIINFINQTLKKAQEVARVELQESINNKSNKVSEKVSKSIEILINRADNELIRSSFKDLEIAIKNQEVLKQNAVNLLKNGLALSNTNCGLRESISDKLKREKLRRECTIRLVVLTKDDFTEEDLIRNLGTNYYKTEVEELQASDVYKHYF